MLPCKVEYLFFELLQPVLEEYQDLRIGDRRQLPGLTNLFHQALAHLRRVDTFAHALGQSEVDHTGNLIVGIPHEIQEEARSGLFIHIREKRLQ